MVTLIDMVHLLLYVGVVAMLEIMVLLTSLLWVMYRQYSYLWSILLVVMVRIMSGTLALYVGIKHLGPYLL